LYSHRGVRQIHGKIRDLRDDQPLDLAVAKSFIDLVPFELGRRSLEQGQV
jgi:hypothetical protein